MSDLAPFVAATIRDKVVMDQQEEIESLKEDNRRLQGYKEQLAKELVQITNQDGSLIYAEGSLAKRIVESDEDGELNHFLRFGRHLHSNSLAPCNVQDIDNAVVQVGGQRVCRLGDRDVVQCISEEGDEDARVTYYFALERPPFRYLGACMNITFDFGPLPEEAEFPHNPNNHQNEEIEDVRFNCIEFNNDRDFFE
jgi:hypothetical protein